VKSSEYAAPTELDLVWVWFYKDVAPMALEISFKLVPKYTWTAKNKSGQAGYTNHLSPAFTCLPNNTTKQSNLI
jgi:hypothetical protein